MTLADETRLSGHALLDALLRLGPQEAATQLHGLLRQFHKPDSTMWAKSDLLKLAQERYAGTPEYHWLQAALRKAPIRSLSGITSLTVLTKPFPCPGKCVFCPVDVRMPKSYIATEPGALRAGRLGFDPYQQVTQRLRAYADMGHPVSKIELIVLGGTWSAYPRDYQIWFVKRLFDGLNDFGVRRDESNHSYPTDWDDHIEPGETYDAHINASQYVNTSYVESATQAELNEAHSLNETAAVRCVGLSLETRPDLLDRDECINLRSLGATKIQIGIQSLDDRVLKLNKRGHTVAKTEQAIRLLRRFGFKVHAHWMANLHGSNPTADIVDYQRIFDNPAIRPDELKVYPTVLIEDTELQRIAARGEWQPFSEEELHRVLQFVLTHTPEYCRLTRIIRDIPAGEILAGNKKGNLRQIVERSTEQIEMKDIRAREIKDTAVITESLMLDQIRYDTADTEEVFLQFISPSDRKIAGLLRLSLPHRPAAGSAGLLDELDGAAIIREVHVYGQSVGVGAGKEATQHRGLGTQLITEACDLAKAAGFENIAVISAVGTRGYYEKLGFQRGDLYQHRSL